MGTSDNSPGECAHEHAGRVMLSEAKHLAVSEDWVVAEILRCAQNDGFHSQRESGEVRLLYCAERPLSSEEVRLKAQAAGH